MNGEETRFTPETASAAGKKSKRGKSLKTVLKDLFDEADAQGLVELLKKDFAGRDGIEKLCHFSILVSNGSRYLNIVGTVPLPAETDAPLTVDPDAVLPLALSLQGLKAITRWCSQVPQCLGGLDHLEFAPRRFLKGLIAPDRLIV